MLGWLDVFRRSKDLFNRITRFLRQIATARLARDTQYVGGKEIALKDHTHTQYTARGEVHPRAQMVGYQNDFAKATHEHPYVKLSDTTLFGTERVYFINNALSLEGLTSGAFSLKNHAHEYLPRTELLSMSFAPSAKFLAVGDALYDPSQYFALSHHTHEGYVKRTEPAPRTQNLLYRTESGFLQVDSSYFALADHDHNSEYVHGDGGYLLKTAKRDVGYIRGYRLYFFYNGDWTHPITLRYITLTLPKLVEERYLPENIRPRQLVISFLAYFHFTMKDAFEHFQTDSEPESFYFKIPVSSDDIFAQLLTWWLGTPSLADVLIGVTLWHGHFSYFVQHVDVPVPAKMAYAMAVPGTKFALESDFYNLVDSFADVYNYVKAWYRSYVGAEPGETTFDPLSMIGYGAVAGAEKVRVTCGGWPMSFVGWERVEEDL